MAKKSVFELGEFPENLYKEISSKFHHRRCSWYPGDGYFKPLSEVRDMTKIHFYGKENIDTKDVYVYEEGDDLVGDFLMTRGIKICEEVLILC